MLTMTENAAAAVKSLVDDNDNTQTAGLRIHGGDDKSARYALTPVASPEPADAVLEMNGARVFLDSGAAAALDDQVLDAEVDSAGAVRFGLAVQR